MALPDLLDSARRAGVSNTSRVFLLCFPAVVVVAALLLMLRIQPETSAGKGGTTRRGPEYPELAPGAVNHLGNYAGAGSVGPVVEPAPEDYRRSLDPEERRQFHQLFKEHYKLTDAETDEAIDKWVQVPTAAQAAYMERARSIVLPEVRFELVPLSQVLPRLEEQSCEADPEGKGIRLVAEFPPPGTWREPLVEYAVKNAPLLTALHEILERAPLTIIVEEDRVVVKDSKQVKPWEAW
jgi:hypothetical protein